jgi:hypothetical protein
MVGSGQFSHAFSGEVYDFYSVSPEYFGHNFVDQSTVTGVESGSELSPLAKFLKKGGM